MSSLSGSVGWTLTGYSENDITGVIEKTFTITEDRFGEMVTTELIPSGAFTRLTEETHRNMSIWSWITAFQRG